MSAGLSMASVNKIKELASRHEYNVAVDILDSQELEKSLNPQFLRVCAEVYENVGRMREARDLYVRAHSIAPEANLIILSLINFHLKRGFYNLAEKYKEQFIATSPSERGQINGQYIFDKANGADLKDLYNMLFPYYRDNMDEKYSFELYLVAKLAGEKETEDIVYSDYLATFKRGEFTDTIKNIKEGKEKAEDYFYIYSSERRMDDDPSEENIRLLERDQLEKDYLRMYPPEEEAIILEDVVEEKKPKVAKKKKKNQKNQKDSSDDADNNGSETDDDAESIDNGVENKLKSFIKDKFKKKTGDGNAADEEVGLEEVEEGQPVNQPDPEGDSFIAGMEESIKKGQAAEVKETSDSGSILDAILGERGKKTESQTDAFTAEAGRGRQEMRELKPEFSQDDVLSFDFDSGFAPESESISEMRERDTEDYTNPFDIINAYKIDEQERKESAEALERKTPEDIRIELEINNVDEQTTPDENVKEQTYTDPSDIAKQTQREIDQQKDEQDIKNAADRISGEASAEDMYPDDLKVEQMETYFRPEAAEETVTETVEEEVSEETVAESTEEVSEETAEEEVAAEVAKETAEEEIPEEIVAEEVAEEYVAVETVEEEIPEGTVTETVEEEIPEEAVTETVEEESITAQETVDDRYETQPVEESAEVPDVEEVPDAVEEAINKARESFSSSFEEEIRSERAYEEEHFGNITFPEFKTDLFNITKHEEIENKFDDIAEVKKEALAEKLEEEERLQREAEELLRSLGIK